MAKLSEHQSGKYTKLMYIGDSGTGKTGSLASLVPDYDLRILDLDNGLDILKAFVKRDNPSRLDSIDFESVRDEYKASTSEGATVDKPRAFVEAAKLLNKWTDDTIPAEWGENTVFVLDSGSTLGRAAFAWARGMNPTAKDPRQWYGSAQAAFENIISMITSDDFKCNVIFITHVKYADYENDGMVKGFPNTVGKALGPNIGKYFNNVVLAEKSGTGQNVKRTIRVVPTDLVDVKTAAPFAFTDRSLPLETGLAEIFRVLRSN